MASPRTAPLSQDEMAYIRVKRIMPAAVLAVSLTLAGIVAFLGMTESITLLQAIAAFVLPAVGAIQSTRILLLFRQDLSAGEKVLRSARVHQKVEDRSRNFLSIEGKRYAVSPQLYADIRENQQVTILRARKSGLYLGIEPA